MSVGKSSLFNRLAGARIAITSDVAGTTRDTNRAEAEIFDRRVRVIDSGGLDDASELFARVQAKTLSEIKGADLIIFMTDEKYFFDCPVFADRLRVYNSNFLFY